MKRKTSSKLDPSFYADEITNTITVSLPVNLEEICGIFDIKVYRKALSGAEAYLYCKNGKKIIVLSEDIKARRRERFTLAHELGHYRLPTHDKTQIGCNKEDISERSSFFRSSQIEKEANVFAANLLMPRKEVDVDTQKGVTVQTISGMRDKYDVSIVAAAIRAVEATYDPMALIFSSEGEIKWSCRSRFLQNNLVTKKVRADSNIGDLYSGKAQYNPDTKRVMPVAWFFGDTRFDYVEEESYVYPQGNAALTLVRPIFEEGDDAFDEDEDDFF